MLFQLWGMTLKMELILLTTYLESNIYTYHSYCGQPHPTSERLKESKVVYGWLTRFLHYKTQTKVHKRLAKVDV